ncbi:MAG: ROK family protein [Candidatus Aminicenantes bacterium]|nr:ROK family protein [Candidatus Aminicenantes bacterium]
MNGEAIVGVDLGATKVSAGRVEENRVAEHFTSEISTGESEALVLDEVIGAVEKVFRPFVGGIGVGVPSLVDVEKGVVYNVQNIPSWREVPLKKILERRFERPVLVNNDANCFAVGEKHFGKGKKFRNLAGLTIGSGLGAGVIIDGRLYCGSNCGAGEFGSVPYRDSILERYCSGQFFLREHGIEGSELYAMARRGDEAALEIFREFGGHMGEAVMIVMFAIDPEAIILGGSVSRAFPFFEEAMREKLKAFPYPHATQKLVVAASDESQMAILGAAALYLDARA